MIDDLAAEGIDVATAWEAELYMTAAELEVMDALVAATTERLGVEQGEAFVNAEQATGDALASFISGQLDAVEAESLRVYGHVVDESIDEEQLFYELVYLFIWKSQVARLMTEATPRLAEVNEAVDETAHWASVRLGLPAL